MVEIKNVFYLVCLWGMFGLVHSIMISFFFRDLVIKSFGRAFETYFYRIFYNLVSLIIYSWIIYFVKSNPNTILLPHFVKYIFTFMCFIGFLIAAIAFFQTDVLEFLGLKQVWRFFTKDREQFSNVFGYDVLVIKGMYRFVRHPMYLGVSLVFLFNPFINLFTITDRICAVSYLFIGTYFEEKRMLRVFGDKYRQYRNNVPRLIPYKNSPNQKE